jgi:hypothetical protein
MQSGDSPNCRERGSCGPLDRPCFNQVLEGVINVMHLLTSKRVDIGSAGDAVDDRGDLGTIYASAWKEQACGACEAEYPADLPFGCRTSVAA